MQSGASERKVQEILPKSGLVVSEKGQLTEVFCKPKILPLKSVTLQKLEEMEKRMLDIAKQQPSVRFIVHLQSLISSMGKGERPEHVAPPELFYDDTEAAKYTTSSRVMEIQEKLTLRALELLALPDDGVPKFILDVGCGSGLSGQVLTDQGHIWVGCDISPSMLEIALEKEECQDLMLHDMGDGLPFRPGTFDGVVSISAVQWLCNADKTHHVPRKRMRRFFRSLYNCLTKGGRAALQIYPENVEQATMLSEEAMKVGFSGGLVVDYPHSTRAKKYYLCLMVGASMGGALPQALNGAGSSVAVAGRERKSKKRKVDNGKDRQWVFKKKAQMRTKGYTGIAPDSKYTGRKRKERF